MRRVAVVGGNGKTGRAVSKALQARAITVSPIGRAELPNLADALRDTDAVYLIAPNMYEDEPGLVDRVVEAAHAAGVRRLGYHSVAAPYAPAMPHHLGKAVGEDHVRRSGLDWTILQPCAYVQNFVPALRSPDPVLRVAYSPRSAFGLVDLVDVAEVAAAVLSSPGHVGATYELGGPAAVSVEDVAAAAVDVLGSPVRVQQIAVDEWVSSDGAQLEPRVREWLVAMFDYYDAHGLPTGPLPLTALLGRSPTSLHETLRRELAAGG